MDQKEKILHEALNQYMKYGIKSITMDDLAVSLGVSKKTIYEYFSDKDELVHQSLQYHITGHKTACEAIGLEHDNPIDELFGIVKFITSQIGEMTPSCMMDLHKFYPKSWKLFMEFKRDYIFQKVYANLEKGIKQKLYRPDINKTIITVIYLLSIESILEDDQFRPKYNISISEVFFERILYHIRAVATPLGIDYLEQKLKKYKDELKKI